MIHGMTGFGSASFAVGKMKGLIEIKSQNHRYFDTAFYLPTGLSSIEDKIRQILEQYLHRGRATITLKITEKPSLKLAVNKEVVKEYVKYSKALKQEFGLDNNLSLSDLIRLPGVVEASETTVDIDHLWPAIEKALLRAVKSLVNMRVREGKAVTADFKDVLSRMSLQIKKIKTRIKELLVEKRRTLSVEEFVSYQKSSDINEELTRLSHFVDEFKSILSSDVGVGKKMDFVAQEMQRETNTIGAKVQDKIVSNAVIALKSKIEKLREQSQNVE